MRVRDCMQGLFGCLLAAMPLLPGPLAAQVTFQAPPGCTPYLTVQHLSCRVSNHWICADRPGHKWRVDIGPNGPVFVSEIDAEAQWIQSFDPLRPDQPTRTVFPAPDAASFTTLLEDGFDDFEFTQIRSDGLAVTVNGADRIVNRDVVIDDVPLMMTEYSMVRTDARGDVIGTSSGREYISTEWRRFFSGRGVFADMTDDGADVPYDRRPVEFILPGEPGFFSNRPKYDCDLLSAAPSSVLPVVAAEAGQ